MINKSGRIYFPAWFNEVAEIIGTIKGERNKKFNESNEYNSNLGEKNIKVDILGVKGEMIFSYHLHTQNVKHTLLPLLNNREQYDIIVGTKNIDVKASDETAKYLLVNERVYNTHKNVHGYAFVKVIDEQHADYWLHSYSEVGTWKVSKFNFTNAYYLLMENTLFNGNDSNH
jgi:hypothetical protein